MILETTEYNTKLFQLAINWYFFEMPKKILSSIGEYMKTIGFIFSFIFLIKTLFVPWRNQSYQYHSKGFDLGVMVEVFGANLISRCVGLFIRLTTLFTGFLCLLLTICIGIMFFFLWVFFPIVMITLILISL